MRGRGVTLDFSDKCGIAGRRRRGKRSGHLPATSSDRELERVSHPLFSFAMTRLNEMVIFESHLHEVR